jgi:hypothetical protein
MDPFEVALVALGVAWTVFGYLLGRNRGATLAYREAHRLLDEAARDNYGILGSNVRLVLDELEDLGE